MISQGDRGQSYGRLPDPVFPVFRVLSRKTVDMTLQFHNAHFPLHFYRLDQKRLSISDPKFLLFRELQLISSN